MMLARAHNRDTVPLTGFHCSKFHENYVNSLVKRVLYFIQVGNFKAELRYRYGCSF